jgi:hypothetical protein
MEEITLSNFFQTKSQATDFSIHLAAISEEVYETSFNLEKALTEHFGMKKKDQFITLLRNNKINVFSNSDLKTFFEKIQATISNLPLLSLVIAFEPTEDTLKMLSEWLLLNIHKEVLFDISIDTKIIAGATISFNGKFADCSIKPKFDQIFQDVLMKKPQSGEKDISPQADHQSVEHITISR